MKFVKGMIMCTLVTAGIAMMYKDSMNSGRKMIMKKGKKMAKRLGIM